MSLCVNSMSEGFVVGSFGFDGLLDTVFEAIGYIYQRHLVFAGGVCLDVFTVRFIEV